MINQSVERTRHSHVAGSDTAPLKLEDFLPYRLNVCAALVSLALSRIYADRYKIGVPEWRVLVTLGQFGMMTGKAIGIHSAMHKTKVSRAVAQLERRKLLARRPNRADLREAFFRSRRPAATSTTRRPPSPWNLPGSLRRWSNPPTAPRSIAR